MKTNKLKTIEDYMDPDEQMRALELILLGITVINYRWDERFNKFTIVMPMMGGGGPMGGKGIS